MDKNEFLNILKQSLLTEVSNEVIEQNIIFYDQYISSRSLEDETRVIEEIGDPRLIAKTIIEKDRAVKQKGGSFKTENRDYKSYSNEETTNQNQGGHSKKSKSIFSRLSWRQKLNFILILIIAIVVLVIIGRIILGFLLAFAIPIILLILVMTLFRKRN